ncbi:hypothetical protein ACFVYE_31965 [Streptomyces sp. NPDC058239]|uniref:hypothetical protein n=1 Tax=Streptomyces sp. NPDC058239 TaxID=3346395 RepID=UPI0036F18C72
MTTQTTTWPEGVIARYITVAGEALSDPSICTEVISHADDYDTARCTPCGSTATYDMEIARFLAKKRGGDPDCLSLAEPSRLAWEWAQTHAEKCRAMPKPTA